MVWAADALVSCVVFKGNPPIAIAFPPHSTLDMEGLDFAFTARTNNLGLRDRDIAPEPDPEVFRILCVGDSFTYGWGVAIEDSWVRLLEDELNEIDGRPVRTINVGRPGTSPNGYAEMAAVAIPLLAPDLVLIGLYQLNDLLELHLEDTNKPAWLKSFMEGLLQTASPNLWRLAGGESKTGATYHSFSLGAREIRHIQKQTAQMHLAEAGEEGRAIFDALEPAIQKAYREGLINPDYLRLVLNYDEFAFVEAFYRGDDTHPYVENALKKAGRALSKIRDSAMEIDAPVVAVSIPDRAFINEIEVERLQRIGMLPDESEIGSQRHDELFQIACNVAGIPLLRTMEAMTKHNREGELYLEHDGHFSLQGNRVFAAIVADRLKEHFIGLLDDEVTSLTIDP